jgi:nucleotide-binding universal stress UspA family protein
VGGTVLVGYDDKEPARRALERAIQEAKKANAELLVVSVLTMPLDPEGPQNFGSLDDSPPVTIPLVVPPDLEPVIEHARKRAEDEGVRADYVWAAGDPAKTIVDAARDRKVSLVVLGAHHHGFLAKLLGVDVVDEVKRDLGADLVIVE